MADGRIVIEMSGDEAKFFQACQKAAEGLNKVEAGAVKAGKAANDAAKEEDALGREAKRVLAEIQTPQDAYNSKVARLSELLDKGKLKQGEYAEAVRHAAKDFQDAADKGEKAFGAKALDTLGNYASGIISIGGAIAGVKKGMEELARIKEEAAQHARESEFSYGSLAEVSKDNPEQFQKNVAMARGIAATTGMDENQAARLSFALISAQATDDADLYAGAYKQGVVRDPENLLRSSTALRRSFGNRMTNRQMLDVAFGAAEGSPSQATALMSASAEAGAYARMAGLDERQLLAATAINASVLDTSGGAEKGGTGVRALFKALGRLSAPPEAAPIYSEEEFQRDKEGLAKERETALQGSRHAALQDPQYRQRFRELEIEKARAKLPQHAGPEAKAEHEIRVKDLADQQRQALEESQRRAEELPQFQNIASKFRLREEELIAKRKASASGIATDDEGTILDTETLKLRQAAGAAIKRAGPDALAQLKAIKVLGLNNAQLQKVFGRSEGLVAMSNILANETGYRELLGAEDEAARTGKFAHVLALPDADESLRAAKHYRVGKGKMIESDRPLGTEENLYESVQAESYIRQGTFGKVAQNLADKFVGWVPGIKERRMREELLMGGLDKDPDLRRSVVQHFGGVESAFSTGVLGIPDSQVEQEKRIYEAAEKMIEAADKFNTVVGSLAKVIPKQPIVPPPPPRPTLGPPNARN